MVLMILIIEFLGMLWTFGITIGNDEVATF